MYFPVMRASLEWTLDPLTGHCLRHFMTIGIVLLLFRENTGSQKGRFGRSTYESSTNLVLESTKISTISEGSKVKGKYHV